MKNETLNESIDNDKYDTYHQLQYDRINHLESRREIFSNYVLTISSGIFTIVNSIENSENTNKILSICLLFFSIVINWIAIRFVKSTMPFIKMHQERAKSIRKEKIPFLNQINETVKKPNPQLKILCCTFNFKRHNIYQTLHYIIIFFISLFIFLILFKYYNMK